MAKSLIMMLVVLLGFQIQAQQFDSSDFTTFVSDQMQAFEIPGVAVAIVSNTETIYIQGFGYTNLETSAPVMNDTQFMIGSTTKTLTATLIGSRVDDGVLEWDVPVVELMPLLDIDPRIEMRFLLANASGLPRFDIPLVLQQQMANDVLNDIEQLELVHEVGSQFLYSNHGVALAGYAAVANGSQYAEQYQTAVQELIFNPLNMARTTFDFDRVIGGNNFAYPYRYNVETGGNESVPLVDERFVEAILPAGGAWSTINDMAQYAQMLLNEGRTIDGTQIITPETLDYLWTPRVPISAELAYGMGWFISEYRNHQQVEHAGNTAGFTATIRLLPEVNLGVVILTNRALSNHFITTLGDYAFEMALALEHRDNEHNLEMQEAQLLAFAPPVTVAVDFNQIAPFLGNYERNMSLSINEDTGVVLVTERGDFPVIQLENGQIAVRARAILHANFQETAEGVTLTLSHPIAGIPLTVKRLE